MTVLGGSLLFAVIVQWVVAHYRLGFSPEAEQSLDSGYFVVRLSNASPRSGAFVAFHLDRAIGRYPAGTWMVKRVVGLPGDLVEVRTDSTLVNGQVVAGPIDGADTLHIDPASLERSFVLTRGHYFVVGTRPHSYDSRYWGPITREQIEGEATLL